MAQMTGMNFNQLSTVLNSIVSQATGKASITPTNETEFISVAQIGLKSGYDPLMNAISQILSRTFFAIRPYSAKFKGLNMDTVAYGNHVRKINFLDTGFEDDPAYTLTDGSSVDQWSVKKPAVLQTNFYGQNIFAKHITIFKDQIDSAFSSSEEFGRFVSSVMTAVSNEIEHARESMARMALVNFIAGKAACDSDNVIYLLDVYEDETGLTGLTPDNIKQPENFPAFAKWLKAYITTLSDLLTERSVKYHKNFTIGGNAVDIPRFTGKANQKCYLYAKMINDIDASVISDVFNKENMRLIDHEAVNFWQSIDTPQGIQVTPNYVDTDGTIETTPSDIVLSNVFGVLFDKDAIGINIINESSAPTPYNAGGKYTNLWYHFTMRWFNDFSENGVVMILDHSDRALGTLTVASVAGTASGDTKITVTEVLEDNCYWAYKIGDERESVTYGMPVHDWTAWDGSDEITAASDKVITVVMANDNNRAIAAGSATVVSND